MMDPLTLGIALALGGGITTVSTKLVEKVTDAAMQPIIDRALAYVQGMFAADDKKKAFGDAVDAALDDATRGDAISRAQKLELQAALARLEQKEFQDARAELVARVLLAASPDDTWLVDGALLDALHLPPTQHAPLARFLRSLRRHLALIPEFKPLLDVAADQNRENALRIELMHLARLSSAVPTIKRVNKIRYTLDSVSIQKSESTNAQAIATAPLPSGRKDFTPSKTV